MADWQATLVDTRTGNLGARLDIASGGTWSDTEATLTALKKSLRGVQPMDWLVPWRTSILLTVDDQPITLGPILNVPSVSRTQVGFQAGSLWDLLAHRIATADDYQSGAGEALAVSTLSLTGSLGTIAWQLVLAAQARTGGALPIVHGSPTEPDPTNERNWKGFDLANLGVAHLLELLSGVIGGPDIRFDVEWANEEHRRVQWVMRHGTRVSPDIPQSVMLVADATAPRGRTSEPQVVCDWQPAAKIYATGAGQDQATMIAIVEDSYLLNNMPLLESTMSDTSAEDLSLLTQRAQTRLERGRTMTVQVNMSLDTDRGMHMSMWHPGDWASVVLGPDWWPLPQQMDARIVARKGRIGSSVVDVEMQAEVTPEWLSANP